MRRAQHRTPEEVDALDSLLTDVGADVSLDQRVLTDGTTLVFSTDELDGETADDVEQALHRALPSPDTEDSEDE